MGKINWSRVLLGGLVWTIAYNVLGAAAWYLILKREWTLPLEALGRPFQETPGFIVFFLLLTLIAGMLAIWFYAAIRPRYGPGPKTAAIAGFAVWVLGSLLPTIAWGRLLLFPTRMLVINVAVSFLAVVTATLVGAWPYKE